MKFLILLILATLQTKPTFANENKLSELSKTVLTSDEIRILKTGPLENPRYITGGILGTTLGFGVGHAIQGRWQNKGWIFTLGESVSLVTLVGAGAWCVTSSAARSFGGEDESTSFSCILTTISATSFIGLRIWESIDLWRGGYEQRKEYKQLMKRLDSNSRKISYSILPVLSANSLGLGLSMRF